MFPACEAAGIERKHPDRERIDPSRPIRSWRSAWRAALKRAGLQLRFHDLRPTCITKLAESQATSVEGWLSITRTFAWRQSERPWTLSPSPFLTGLWHKIGHSRRASKKLLSVSH